MGAISGDDYNLTFDGDQVDAAIAAAQSAAAANGILECDGSGNFSARGVDTTPTANSTNLVTSDGIKTYVDGSYTIAGQMANTTLGTKATAEGNNTIAQGNYSHAEGYNTTASGVSSHAEGYNTTASGGDSHAEGAGTTASGWESHAEGQGTEANGDYAHTEGLFTTANHRSQHVFGEYNTADPSTAAVSARGDYVEIVGNGTAYNARSNARTLDWSGNETLSGSITLGKGTADETTLTAASLKRLLALLT